MSSTGLTKLAMTSALASTAFRPWGSPMEMVDDAFGVHHGPNRSLMEVKRKLKADKARKAAKKARKSNRRK